MASRGRLRGVLPTTFGSEIEFSRVSPKVPKLRVMACLAPRSRKEPSGGHDRPKPTPTARSGHLPETDFSSSEKSLRHQMGRLSRRFGRFEQTDSPSNDLKLLFQLRASKLDLTTPNRPRSPKLLGLKSTPDGPFWGCRSKTSANWLILTPKSSSGANFGPGSAFRPANRPPDSISDLKTSSAWRAGVAFVGTWSRFSGRKSSFQL